MKKFLYTIMSVVIVSGVFFSVGAKPSNSKVKYTVKETIEKNADGQEQYSVRYPVFEGAEQLNAEIQKLTVHAYNEITGLKASVEEEKTFTGETPYYWLIFDFDEPIVSENYISVLFYLREYTGGAHGMTTSSGVTYNRKTKTIVSLEDILLPKNKNWLKILSQYCIRDLLKQSEQREGDLIAECNWFEEGAGENAENFTVFTIDDNGITVYFQEYQVWAYAYGAPSVKIPFSVFEK